MKFKAFLIFAAALISGCAGSPQPKDTLTQVAAIDSLRAGVYDGILRADQLLQYGDLGVGTFDRLDGEMIVSNGTVYQIKADGKVYTPPLSTTTPFAAVCRFVPNHRVAFINHKDAEGVQRIVENAVSNPNTFCAVRITGEFSWMKTRSVPAQTPPYPPFSVAAEHQSIFKQSYVTGTVVGFRLPPFVKGVNVPGYHLHFLSSDLKSGGHILDFEMLNGVVEIDVLDRLYLILPEDASSFK